MSIRIVGEGEVRGAGIRERVGEGGLSKDSIWLGDD